MTTRLFNIDPVLVDAPMPIITPRLILRPPQAGDGHAMQNLKEESWPELQKWMSFAQDPAELTWESNEISCRTKQAEYLLRKDIMLFGFDRNDPARLIVSTGLHVENWNARIFEIGFWVRSNETGKGYATESTNAILRYAFEQMSANRVYIAHDPDNHASRRVIEKLGFIKEGESRIDDVLGDCLRGTCHYARYDLNGLPPLDVQWETVK